MTGSGPGGWRRTVSCGALRAAVDDGRIAPHRLALLHTLVREAQATRMAY